MPISLDEFEAALLAELERADGWPDDLTEAGRRLARRFGRVPARLYKRMPRPVRIAFSQEIKGAG